MASCRRRSRQCHGDDAFGPGVPEPFLPAPDHRLGFTACLHDLGSAATILAHQTCFCGLLRLANTASSLLRSAALNRIFVRSCSHTLGRQEIFKRIEMSDLVH